MNTDTASLCQECCEPIAPQAQKCPRCRRRRRGFDFPGLALSGPMLLVLALGFWRLTHVLNQGESFAAEQSPLRVTQSALQPGELGQGRTMAVIGIIDNESDHGWKNLRVEVHLTDGVHEVIYRGDNRGEVLAVPPKGTCAFKVSMPRQSFPPNFTIDAVRISAAEDADRFH